ncbi:hypothetical protein ACIBHX_27530 [Nonomuraea sp. NPDC050536]|uniref:hypothetical protein n=1 Tax=Nonomuraea sp. NPDC050536 TaxID=3364366 RepID=UPI0037C4EFF9
MEDRLRAAFVRGNLLDLRSGGDDDPRQAATWPESRQVSAASMTALLLGGAQAEPGQVAMLRLAGARITGQLDLDGAELSHRLQLVGCVLDEPLLISEARTRSIALTGCVLPEMRAAMSRIDGSLTIHDCALPELDLHGTTVSDDLIIEGGTLKELDATTVQVHRHLILGPGLTIEGTTLLNYATVGGQARITETTLGPVEMHRARFDTDLFVARPSKCTGRLAMTGAIAAGRVDLELIEVSELGCEEVQAGVLHLPAGVTRLDLDSARVGVLRGVARPYPRQLSINGLTYDAIEPSARTGERLEWIRLGSHRYRSQPYEQLAAMYKRDGHEVDARTVLLAKQRHRRRMLQWRGRLLGLLQDVTAGYGYRSWWAGLWLAAFLAAGTAYFQLSPPAPLKPGEHPDFNAFAYTLDLLLPMVDLGQTPAWNPHGPAQAVAYALLMLGWLLTLSVATGVARVLFRD